MTFKEKVYHSCCEMIDSKIEALQKNLNDLSESAGNETKRTAGDKHETALAMLQIEQENIQRQLQEKFAQKNLLSQIDPCIQTVQVCKGSVVSTDKGVFFISTALGKITIDDKILIVVSSASPIAAKMMGLRQGDQFTVNNTDYMIEDIC